MTLILKDGVTKEQIVELTICYPGYTKIVVDIQRNVLAAGGEYHVDCEQILLANGSDQKDLWGGGYRFESDEVDFVGLTNYKIGLNHLSYEITFPEIRNQVENIIRKVFKNEQK